LCLREFAVIPGYVSQLVQIHLKSNLSQRVRNFGNEKTQVGL